MGQGPGYRNVLASLRALKELAASSFPELGPVPTRRRSLLVTGHSNGGYGAWSFASKHPDSVVALAPLAGMPSLGWSAKQWSDPGLNAIMAASIQEWNGDTTLAAANFGGRVAFLARTGENDRTITPQMTRKMSKLVRGVTPPKSAWGRMVEVPGKAHWWWDTVSENDGGVMDDAEMAIFWQKAMKKAKRLNAKLKKSSNQGENRKLGLQKGQQYSCYNPSTCGEASGITILSLFVPFRLASFRVTERDKLETFNIQRLHLSRSNMPDRL